MLIRYLSDVHLEYRKPADGFLIYRLCRPTLIQFLF